MESQVGELDPDLFDVVLVLAKVLRDAGRYSEAIACFERRAALVLARARLWYGGEQNADPTNAGGAWLELADVRFRAGDLEGAERDARIGLAHYERCTSATSRSIQTGRALTDLGDVLVARQRTVEAEASHREALSRLIAAVGGHPEDYLRAFEAVRQHVAAQEQEAGIQQLAEAELARLVAWSSNLGRVDGEAPQFADATRGNFLRVLGVIQVAAGDRQGARKSLEAALPRLVAAYGPEHRRTTPVVAELTRIGG